MQFNNTSDYAIRVVLYLAINESRACSAKEIEENVNVPSSYLYKLTKELRKANILTTEQGPKGGYRLLKNAKEITLYDILSLTEQTMKINGCLEDKNNCSRNYATECKVRKVFSKINKEINTHLKNTTLYSLTMMEREY